MRVPLLSCLPVRLRVFLLWLTSVIAFGGAAALFLLSTVFADAPPSFQTPRTIPNTDVNPYGANFFLEREVEAWKRERTVRMAREAGIGWARQEFIWAEIESDPGVYNWSKYDDIVDLLQSNGIQVIARLDRPPAWARTQASATGSSGPPDDFDAYGKFIEAFARHFEGKVFYFQIWNEPNLAREWNDAPVDPAAYTRLLKIAYLSAKGVDTDIRILSAPLAITLGEPFAPGSKLFRNMNDLQYLEGMYAAGARDFFDILSANAFGLGSPPDDPASPDKLNFQRVRLERQVMEKFDDANKAVWILEYGWNAAPASFPDSRLIWGRVTEQQQAEYTIQGIDLARENWNWVGMFSMWYFRQVGDISPSNPEYYFRMVDVDFTPRPVYFATSQATHDQQVASPGHYQETNPALSLKGAWSPDFDPRADGGAYAFTHQQATGALRFAGDGLDLYVHQMPGAGRLFVTIDGNPVPGLPQDATGQSYIEEASAADTWRAIMPVARNLPRAVHLLEFHAEGEVNLDAFEIPQIQPMQPPWLPIGVLGCLGLGSLTLAVAEKHRARR